MNHAIGPHTITVLCTYQCTAACKQCCFECSPRIKSRLKSDIIRSRIDEAVESFESLRLAVFSGGEALLLGAELFALVSHCTGRNLITRIVSNGYWGRTEKVARSVSIQLAKAGLKEINISTGHDHQEWIPVSSVAMAASCAADEGIATLITVECNETKSETITHLLRDKRLAPHLSSQAVSIQSNSWMPFLATKSTPTNPGFDTSELRRGCDQVLRTLTITPHDNLSACCGLTLEHIPEIRLGRCNGSNLRSLFDSQYDDFLKLWIHADGPYSIVEQVMGDKASTLLSHVVHPCEACAILHKSPATRNALHANYRHHIPNVLTRIHISDALDHAITQRKLEQPS